jgi:Protein of unknown function (DUF992)
MRRSFTLAGVAATLLVASLAGVYAQQPMQRVQVGILECRGGSSVGFIVGSVTNLGCVLRAGGPLCRHHPQGRPRSRHYPGIGAGLGRVRAGRAARARRSLGQLRRCAGQRHDRRRRRRQCAGRRFGEFDRAAAAQRAGPGRPQRRGRAGQPGTSPGKVGLQDAAPRPGHGALHRSDIFPACQIPGTGGASSRRPNQGPSSR